MKDSDWELLYELYRTPSMTKVANILYISQPSLTKRLKRIEAEFDVTIVTRSSRGLEFTPEGKYLAKQAEIYLQFMKQTRNYLDERAESEDTILNIGSSYTYSKYTLTEQLIRYRMLNPKVKISVQNAPSNILFRNMVENKLDVAFVRGDYEGGVNRIKLEKNFAYLMTDCPVESIDKIKHMNRLWYSTNAESKALLDKWWEDWFHEPVTAGQPLGHIDVIWQMIKCGQGYTICFLPKEYTNPDGLCLKPLQYRDGTPVYRNTWFLYPKNKRTSPAINGFVEFILQDALAKKCDA